jgi:nitroreductase
MAEQTHTNIDLASVDHVLKTTRTVRLRLDLERTVPDALIEQAIDVALQAPTGANSQTWRFVVVTDEKLRAGIAELYRMGAERYLTGETGVSRTGIGVDHQYAADDPRQQRMSKVIDSAMYLIENIHRVPVHIMLFLENRFEHEDVFTQSSMWGSILPAAWSLQLALRARGVASAWTTFTLMHEKEIQELLGVPAHYTQAVLLPVAWLKGPDLRPAKRFPARDVTYWNGWGKQRSG